MTREKHYKMNKQDFDALVKGEEVFFYKGKHLHMHIRLNDEVMKSLKGNQNDNP